MSYSQASSLLSFILFLVIVTITVAVIYLIQRFFFKNRYGSDTKKIQDMESMRIMYKIDKRIDRD